MTTVAGVEIKSLAEGAPNKRFSAMIWGPPSAGKTTLAATAPGKKLLLLFDADGAVSLGQRDDVDVVDLTGAPDSVAAQVMNDNPFGLKTALANYDTLIVDSLTNFSHKALMHGVASVRGATPIQPTQQGWGYRTGLTLQLAKNLTILTKRLDKHMILIAHEAKPDLNGDGTIASVRPMLGGDLPTSVSVDLSEIWNVTDVGSARRIAFRPVRNRTPLKTRMFITSGAPEFVWKYDVSKPNDAPENKGHRIADWFEQWSSGHVSASGKIVPPA